DGKTVLFVNNREFKQCKILLLNVLVGDQSVEETNSIDGFAEKLDFKMEYEKEEVDITEEEEFLGHCSNLQAWVENNYDTNLLHRSIAFPLLKTLSEEGDRFAKQRFDEEVARRYKHGNDTVQRFLYEEGYISNLSNEDILKGFLSVEEAIFMEKIMGDWEQYSLIPHFGYLRKKARGKELYISLEDGKIRELEIAINRSRQSIPKEIENLQNLYSLDIFIEERCAGKIFNEMFCLPSVRSLDINCSVPETIPDSFDYFPNLHHLRISGNKTFKCPSVSFESSFKKITNLEWLDLNSVRLESIPNSIINLKKLERLSLFKTTLKTLPVPLICALKSLKVLELNYNFELGLKKREIKKLDHKIEQFSNRTMDDYLDHDIKKKLKKYRMSKEFRKKIKKLGKI
ncbi:hypothetical protein LCGC14_1421710, partial [marine sediment metagenome]